MATALEETVPLEELKKFEAAYQSQLAKGKPSAKAQFEYAWCLVRTKDKNDLRIGTHLLKDLFQRTTDETAKRDYLFYLAVGHARLKEYEEALKYVDAILTIQPSNHQAKDLRQSIKKKMQKDGLIGMAVVGGAAAVAVAGIATLIGVAVAKK